MNPTLTADTEPGSPQEVASERTERKVVDQASLVEIWLNNHLNAVALAVVAIGFGWRIWIASRNYLNPDELLHFLIIHQNSLYLAYKASLTNAHPPLFYIFLYLAHLVSSSELVLRLPSVIAGTAFCWILFKWIGMVLGKTAGLIGLIVVTFCPAIINLSAEMRQYDLLLLCIASALYFLTRTFQEKSVRRMWGFSVFLYLAILSHYSAVFFTLAIGIYSLARIADSQLPRKVIAAWWMGQVGALAVYGFLYVTHVSKLKNNIAIWGSPFEHSYFRLDREDIFTFTWNHTLSIFLYLFKQRQVSQVMLLFFFCAAAILFFRDLLSRSDNISHRHLGILLLLPFVAVWGASIAGIYPYVGTRHTVFLASFVIAGVSFFLAAATRQKLWAGLLIAGLLMGVSNASGNQTEEGITKENQSRSLMMAAVNHLEQSVPQGGLILVDYQSSMALAYYLCGPKGTIPLDAYRGDNSKYNCAGYSIVPVPVWKLVPQNFPSQFQRIVHLFNLKPGDRVWIFQAGWGDNFDKTLPKGGPAFRCITPKSFGTNVTVTPFVVGPDFLPASPMGAC